MTGQSIEQLILQANNGDPQACFDLYQEYRHGIHVSEDDQTAKEWLEKAIDFNHPIARLIQEMDLLAKGYVEEAIGMLEVQCAQNNADAMNVLGQVYLGNVKNVGTQVLDIEKGIDLVMQAAAQGNVEAQILLGKCYYTGKWVAPNKFAARYWLEKAARAGNETASLLYDEACRVVTDLN